MGFQLELTKKPEYGQLFYTLGHYAPYCGTGHKTTFGLGQTQLGWHPNQTMPELPSVQVLLAERIDELTQIFIATKKRTGGNRARESAEAWAYGAGSARNGAFFAGYC